MKIHISDYKNIKDITFTVTNNIAILLGPNGAGKTNILEAINSGACEITDCDQEFSSRYFLSLEASGSMPAEDGLKEFFSFSDSLSLSENILNFLEESYREIKRPFLKKMLKDALESIRYADVNRHFDPSTLAIIRLALLGKIYRKTQETKEPCLVLIDTPEIFAHPALREEITSLLGKLQQGGNTVILSTHSDAVIARLFTRFEEIIKVTKNSEGLMQIKVADMTKTVEKIRAFYMEDEELTNSFSAAGHKEYGIVKLLENDIEGYLITALRDKIITAYFSEVIILGEGSSEDVLFDYIDYHLHPSWISEYQVGFISCMGKSTMPLYFIFLNELGVRTFLMYDYDNSTNPVHVAYRQAYEKYHELHPDMFREYYIKPDLENYLNFTDGTKIASLIKPVNIYNYTFLLESDNEPLKELIELMKVNSMFLYGHKEK